MRDARDQFSFSDIPNFPNTTDYLTTARLSKHVPSRYASYFRLPIGARRIIENIVRAKTSQPPSLLLLNYYYRIELPAVGRRNIRTPFKIGPN